MTIIEAKDLVKNYSNSNGGNNSGENGKVVTHALRKTSLSVSNGEFVSIAGPSGCGKSTLMHLLGGLDQPTEGRVIIEGTSIYEGKEEDLALIRRRKIGFVFQFYNLIPVLNAEENVLLPLLLDGRPVDRDYVEDLFSTLGISGKKGNLPSQLSGGEQQRVAIARALCTRPAIVLADEPTGNLDSQTSEEVLNLLKLSVKKYNQTLIMVTHNPEIAARADRIITMKDGIIAEDRVVRV